MATLACPHWLAKRKSTPGVVSIEEDVVLVSRREKPSAPPTIP